MTCSARPPVYRSMLLGMTTNVLSVWGVAVTEVKVGMGPGVAGASRAIHCARKGRGGNTRDDEQQLGRHRRRHAKGAEIAPEAHGVGEVGQHLPHQGFGGQRLELPLSHGLLGAL
jgi:hypothetical protein